MSLGWVGVVVVVVGVGSIGFGLVGGDRSSLGCWVVGRRGLGRGWCLGGKGVSWGEVGGGEGGEGPWCAGGG